MLHALQSTGHPIYVSICNWGSASVSTWGNAIGNSYRISCDISPGRGELQTDGRAEWSRIAEFVNMNSFHVNEVGFWGKPDPAMLEVGNGNLTLAENRAHLHVGYHEGAAFVGGGCMFPTNPSPLTARGN
jgi:alpha-galactosidase